MDFDIAPLLNKKSTKKLVLDALIEKQPQSLKEIHTKIKKHKNVTYQAIHKAIKEMQDDGIVNKNINNFYINQNWISNLFEIINKLNNNGNNKNTRTYTFRNYSGFAKFVITQLANIPHKNLPSICIMRHSWPPIGLDEEDLLKISNFLKNGEYYDLTINKTPLDLAFAKTLEKLGKHILVGKKFNIDCDLLIQGDTLITVIFNKKLKDNLNKIFKKYKSINEDSIQEIITKIVTIDNDIKVLIENNPEECMRIRNLTLKKFNTAQKRQ